jgi:hypothetical protein
MFASIRTYHFDSGNVDDLMREVESSLVPALSKAPGYQGHYEIVAGDGSIVSITGVLERGQLRELNEIAQRWAHEHLHRFKAHRIEASEGEVRVVSRAPSAARRSG